MSERPPTTLAETALASPPLGSVADVWSATQLVAFSGQHGATHWSAAPEAWLLPDQFGLRLEGPRSVTVALHVLHAGQPLPGPSGWHCQILADGFQAALAVGAGRLELGLRFAAEGVLHGWVRGSGVAGVEAVAEVALTGCTSVSAAGLGAGEEGLQVLTAWPAETVLATVANDLAECGRHHGDALAALPQQGPAARRAVVARGAVGAAGWACAIATGDPDELTRPELPAAAPGSWPAAPPDAGPPALPPALARTRAKALAVLGAHVFAAEGNLPHRWIVPQRSRHRNFNTFHAPFLAAGVATCEPLLAAEVLRCTLAQQQPSGHIPEQAWPFGQSLETPPPLLCWGFWRVYRATGDRNLLAEALPRLKDYVKYPLAARMLERLGHARSNGAKFLTWGRGEGSNMDNSPRFDLNESFAAVDLTCFACAEVELVARIIEELTPEHREAVHLGWMAEELARESQEYFWDEQQRFFVDRYPDDDPVDALTVAGLIPLFAGVATPAQAEELVAAHLQQPEQFWTPFPLASLARCDARFSGNMWRGAAWPSINVLCVAGLRRYGYDDLAAELRQRTLDEIARWYVATGTLWEYYDSLAAQSPADLPRGRRTGALPDYALTAACFLHLLHESAGA
ncbi:MAG: hypothetical protein IT204_03465 [Fimbriimonadaceae bacterium]|nr:hypothetical protein [Fimbriimonadaceae bacterium]